MLEHLDTIFKLLEILSIVGGGAIVVWKMAKMTTRFELIGVQQASEIASLKVGVLGLNNVLITLAQESGRIDRAEDRQLAQGKRLDEITTRINTYFDLVRSRNGNSIQPQR